MVLYPHSDKDEVDVINALTVISNKTSPTMSTIISISKDVEKVESLLVGKSLGSFKSVALGDAQPTSIKLDTEKWYSITLQVFIPFMIAGMGTIGAGLVLGGVQEADVFKDIKALYILVPAILGLKGNLDMCLASRLSTQANLGHMKNQREMLNMMVGNISLVQIQAIVASCLVSLFAVGVYSLLNGSFEWQHALLLAASSVLTATMSCFILDFVLIAVIIISRKAKLNPDNVATPFAASIGDVVSLVVLSTWAKFLYSIHDDYPALMVAVLLVYLGLLLPFWVLIVRKNQYTRKVLLNGWAPVLGSLIISGMGGLVLDAAVDQFYGFVVFQPIINGIGGNLVSVQASRISTMLHKTSLRGVVPPHTRQWVWPWQALFKGVLSAKSARILMLLAIPGQTVFVFLADFIYNEGKSCIHMSFVIGYLSVSLVQIMLLLYICHIMIHTLWRFKIDPDNSAIPYLTALGDLLGSCLLLLAFVILKSVHSEYGSCKMQALNQHADERINNP